MLRTSAAYRLHWSNTYGSTGAQDSHFVVAFGDGTGPKLDIHQWIDYWYNLHALGVHLQNAEGGDPMVFPDYVSPNTPIDFRSSDDVIHYVGGDGWVDHTYWFEIVRDGQQVTVSISTDGTTFTPARSFTLPPVTGATQRIGIYQAEWAEVGSFTDWDYISVHELGAADNQPPVVTGAFSSVNCLWPPNHALVDGQVLGVTDPDGDPVTITITGITSDEPTATDVGSGGATHSPDASGVGMSAFKVRAERSGDLNGRVYAVTFTASDGQPNGESTGTIYVKVPHDQSKPKVPCTAIDDGQNYDATAIN